MILPFQVAKRSFFSADNQTVIPVPVKESAPTGAAQPG